MPRTRVALQKEWSGGQFTVRFRHPLLAGTKKPFVRWKLGASPDVADTALAFINKIFLHPEHWGDPPKDIPADIRKRWLLQAEGRVSGQPGDGGAAIWKATASFWRGEYLREHAQRMELEKKFARLFGQRYKTGPSMSLTDALTQWKKTFTGRDPDHINDVNWELGRFVKHFAASGVKEVDYFIGREAEIGHWLRALKTKDRCDEDGKVIEPGRPISAGRRQQIRRYVLRFVEFAGAAIERKAVPSVRRKEVRADRGAVVWLEKIQVTELVRQLRQLFKDQYLNAYWADMFELQTEMGFRPNELLTLQRSNFSTQLERVTLAPLKHLTLKEGSRTVKLSPRAKQIVEARLKLCDVLFPQLALRKEAEAITTGAPWKNAKYFDKRYNAVLQDAAAAVKADKQALARIDVKLDCRIGRRSCATQLLISGFPVKFVADFLGDDPETILEHYGAVISDRFEPKAAV